MADMLGSTLLNVGAETQRGGEVGFLDHGGNGYNLVGVSGQWSVGGGTVRDHRSGPLDGGVSGAALDGLS